MGYEMHVQNAPGTEQATCIERGFALGTTRLRQAMIELGMAHRSLTPQFPDSDHLDHLDFLDEQPVTQRALIHAQALRQTQVDHGTYGSDRLSGIPAHKIASGDGWHVTAEECDEALAAYQYATTVAGAPHPDAFGDDVIPFLCIAARHEGFRVH